MKFEYTSYWDSATPNLPLKKRSLIEIELFVGSKSIKIPDALVDSGADYCLFNIAYADALGIDIGKCPKIYFTGIGGLMGKIPAYMAEVNLAVKYLENKIAIFAGFIESDSVVALLGQEGFFDNFRIKFEKDHNTFEINPVKKK